MKNFLILSMFKIFSDFSRSSTTVLTFLGVVPTLSNVKSLQHGVDNLHEAICMIRKETEIGPYKRSFIGKTPPKLRKKTT